MTDPYSQLAEQLSRVRGVRGALIVDAQDGVPVVAELSDDIDGGAASALAAALFQRTARATDAADFGGLRTAQLDAEEGYIIMAGAKELIAVAVADRDGQLGEIRLQVQRTAEALS